VRYQPETVAEAYASRAGYGAPGWQVDAWVSTYTAIASGELAGVTDDIARLTGHPATSLAALLRRGGSAYLTERPAGDPSRAMSVGLRACAGWV